MTDELTEKANKQRQEAAVKHGAFSKMTPEKVSRLVELQEQLSTRPGLLEVQKDQAAKAVELTNVLMSWVIQQHKSGKALDEIPALNRLPAYMNSSNRALKQLYEMLPDSKDVLDLAEHVTQAMNKNGDS